MTKETRGKSNNLLRIHGCASRRGYINKKYKQYMHIKRIGNNVSKIQNSLVDRYGDITNFTADNSIY